MDVLVPSFWASFKKRDNNGKETFNGEQFEELIRLILESHFGGNWSQTATTWDGGKDFVDRSIAGEEAWAECKMYKSALSIKVVSNTLVMAVSNSPRVQRLLIFSHSPLNENAKRHLSRFSESVNISVQAFDDKRLEDLVLGSKPALRKFFPQALHFYRDTNPAELDIIPLFSTDVHVEYAQLSGIDGVNKIRKPFVPINTPCLYEIFLRSNKTKGNHEVVFDFAPLLSPDIPIRFLNWESINTATEPYLKKDLLPGELTSVKILLAPVSTDAMAIPAIPYRSEETVDSLPLIPIKVPRLNRPSLVGKSVYEALEAFETRVSGKNTITLAVVSGKSGVGKTRFLEEAEMRLLSHNYLVLRMDGRDNNCETFNSFAVTLLAQVWRLPNINLFASDSNKHVGSGTGDTLFDRVCSYLYPTSASTKILADELEQILDLVVQGLISQRTSLLIDNTQKLDRFSLLLISKLSERITGTVGQATVLLAFNEDELIYSTDATLLLDKFKKAAAQEHGPWQYYELPEFNRNSVEMFLNTICGYMDSEEKFTAHYPRLTQLIYESVLPRPLDLYQLFLAAQDDDKQIARIEDGFFFVKDIEAFHELVKGVNKTTEAILTMRIKSLATIPSQLRLLYALAQIGESDANLFISISNCAQDDLDRLVEGGWMRYTSGNQVDFYHPSIERFLINIIVHENRNEDLQFVRDSSVRWEVAQGLQQSGFAESFPLARFSLSGGDDQILIPALKMIKGLEDSVPTIRKRLHAQSLYEFIIYPHDVSPESYIDCIQAICNLAAEGQIRNFVDRLWTCRKRLNSFVPTSNDTAYALCSIVRQYASYSNLLGEPDLGEQALRDELPKIELLPDTVDEHTRSKITVNYMNRRCVCLKDMGETQKAERIGKQALALATQFNHKEFTCLTLIDLCAIYRNEKRDWEQYSKYLDEALLFFKNNMQEINELEPSIEFACIENEAQLEGLRGNTTTAIQLAEKLIHRTKRSYTHYYLLRGLLAKAVVSCRQQLSEIPLDGPAIEVLTDLLKEIEDLSIISRFDRFHIKALHLQAIVNTSLGNISRAKALFTAALEKVELNLSGRRNKSYIIPSDKALLWDAANFWIDYVPDAPFPAKRSILNGTNASEVHAAIAQNIKKSPFTLFATGAFNYPFP